MLGRSLRETRSALTPEDRDILDRCWSYYNERGEHIPQREIFYEFERPTAEAALQRLPRSVLHKAWGSTGDVFKITLMGALVSSIGEDLETLLEEYLGGLKKAYDIDHRKRYLSHTDLKQFVPLSDERLQALGRLLSLGGEFAGTSATTHTPDGAWGINISDEAEEIRRIQDYRAYLQEQLVAHVRNAEFSAIFPRNRPQSSFAGVELGRALESSSSDTRSSDTIDFGFMHDRALRMNCERDWQDALATKQAGLIKPCVLMSGGVAEALLLDCLEECDQTIVKEMQRQLNIASQSLDRLGLDELIKLAHKLGKISGPSTHLSHFIREYRNMIHPARQRRAGRDIHSEDATIAIAAVRSLARDLANS